MISLVSKQVGCRHHKRWFDLLCKGLYLASAVTATKLLLGNGTSAVAIRTAAETGTHRAMHSGAAPRHGLKLWGGGRRGGLAGRGSASGARVKSGAGIALAPRGGCRGSDQAARRKWRGAKIPLAHGRCHIPRSPRGHGQARTQIFASACEAKVEIAAIRTRYLLKIAHDCDSTLSIIFTMICCAAASESIAPGWRELITATRFSSVTTQSPRLYIPPFSIPQRISLASLL